MSEVRNSGKVTLSLQRLRASMEASVSVSTSAVLMLDGDGDIIRETLDTHKHQLSGELHTTSSKLRRVQDSARGERWLVFASVLFFTSAVVFIVIRRLGLISLAVFSVQAIFRTSSGQSEVIHASTVPIQESCPIKEDVVWGIIRY